jgi:phage tail sheath protein FI
MPEYLTPGVYLEETSFRSRSIEGVPTSTFGMSGLTSYGPVPYVLPDPSVTMVDKPTLVTSFTEFERAFGGLDEVGSGEDTTNYVAYAARAFFDNGGRRLYVSRVFPFTTAVVNGVDVIDVDANFARLDLADPGGGAAVGTWRARWPGEAGRRIAVQVVLHRSKNVLVGDEVRGASPGAAVELAADAAAILSDNDPVDPANLRIVTEIDNAQVLLLADGSTEPLPTDGRALSHLTFDLSVTMGAVRADVYSGLEIADPNRRAIHRVMDPMQPTDSLSLVWLDLTRVDNAGAADPASAQDVLAALAALRTPTFLSGGGEGNALAPDDLKGTESDPDNAARAATGLAALGEIDDIAIVAAPDTVRFTDPGERTTATQDLITHCERLRYRIGIIDPPGEQPISGVRAFRSLFDSKYAALYYPWVEIIDPTAVNDPGSAPATKVLPPSGFAAGIYARSDVERGVHKAPANEVIRGITRFMQNVTFDRQSVLNPEGINALRFFPGRSNRVWGARTISSDPEWKYVNVRRLFIYLEHSIEKSTQWAVFEPNNEALWANVRQTISDFLLATWRTGALMGTKPEEAFFVRCDRSTMTQNDLDNGRLICLIGVAPTYPAEFVIFRIGQWTADARQS